MMCTALVALLGMPLSALAWGYTWDDPVLYDYCTGEYCDSNAPYVPQKSTLIYGSVAASYGPFGYGYYGAYGTKGYGVPTGEYLPFINEPICDYPGYGRGSCMYHPSQPLYDPWTGTWY